MSTRFQPFRVPDPTGGWQPDIPPEKLELSMWPVVQNARFYDKLLLKTGGWIAGASGGTGVASGQPGLICRARFSDGGDIPIVATDTNIYKLSPAGVLTALNAAPYGTNPGVRWETDSFPGSVFLNRCDGFGQIKKWVGGANILDLNDPSFGTMYLNPGYTAPPTGKTLQQYANHLFIADLTNDGAGNIGLQTAAGSDIADGIVPQGENDWQFADQASEADLIGFFAGNDPIQRILRLNDYLVIYKENSIQMLAYTGGTFTYLNQQPIAWLGTPSPHSVIGIRGVHFFVGQDGIYKFNGSEVLPIGDGVYQTFLSLVMPTDNIQLWAWNDPVNSEINWVGQNGNTLVYNYDNGAFSFKFLNTLVNKAVTPFTAMDYVNLTGAGDPSWNDLVPPYVPADPGSTPTPGLGSWRNWGGPWYPPSSLNGLSLLAADKTGILYTFGGNNVDANGTPIDMLLETADFDFGDPSNVKMVNELRIEGNTGGQPGNANDTPLTVKVGIRDNLGVVPTWSAPYQIVNNRVTFAHSARWFRFRFEKHGGQCSIERFTPFFRERGRY